MQLYKPRDYLNASDEKLRRVCNGCGAKGGIKVPNKFLGLDIKEACNIHDWMYEKGETYADFLFSNAMFLFNLVVIIINGSNVFTRALRLIMAVSYFLAVMKAGKSIFFENKIENKKMNITYKGIF